MKTKDFALEVKAVNDEGTFEGYGSVFGVRDTFNEVVESGAFSESLRKRDWPLLLWQHQSAEPIGVWEDLAEDKKGLWGKGRLLKGVQKAEEAHIRLKAGAVKGLSIGYRELEVQEPTERTEPRRLIKLDLLEISIVSFPANPKARVDLVKSEHMEDFARRLRDGDPPPIKEFEDILRESGIPKTMALAIASHGYAKAIRSESEGTQAKEAAVAELRAAVSGFLTPS